MTDKGESLHESAEGFFEGAPCGFVCTRADGTIIRANRTLESWTGRSGAELRGLRFQDLLSPGGRIYYETHYSPLLLMQGSVKEIALEIVRSDGSRLPALINSALGRDGAEGPQVIRTTIFDATDRRRYEQELLLAQRREQEVALQLQSSMLAGRLPSVPGLELDVAYRPAVSGLAVGGDWYDAFWLDAGETIGLVVGDVVGRGIEAAATMGQLRSALRALASTGLSPGLLLDALDGYSRRHEVGEMTTLVYAQLNLPLRQLCYACAGHLPPAIATHDEAPFLAWEGRSKPLDMGARTSRKEAQLSLRPGSTIVLYSDGLVESRSRSVDDGMNELLTELADDPRVAAQILVHRLRDTDDADDVCVIAARLGE